MNTLLANDLTWYSQGNWPLVGAVITLVISNAVALWQIVLQSNRSFSTELALKRIELLSEQLSGFSNPLHALLSANRHVFEHFGPHSFPQDEIKRQTAAETWNTLRDCVVLPNNEQIVSILRDKSHLISEVDDIDHYLDLNNHIHFYRVFNDTPTEAYQNYRFPTKVVEHLERKRSELVCRLAMVKSLKDL